MKKATSLLTFNTVILFIATLFLLPSCTKKENEDPACLAIFAPDLLRINVVDKTTGSDLFFPTIPRYTVDDITYTIGNEKAKIKPKIDNSTTLGKHFVIPNNSTTASSIKIYILDELKFTIDYTTKKQNDTKCSNYIFDKLTINGSQKEENTQDRIIKLKL